MNILYTLNSSSAFDLNQYICQSVYLLISIFVEAYESSTEIMLLYELPIYRAIMKLKNKG